MVSEGLLKITTDEGQPAGFARLASVLGSVRIGFGRERYLETLDEHLKALQARVADPESLRDEDGQVDTQRRALLEERLNDVRVLRGLVKSLLAISPRADDLPAAVLGLRARVSRATHASGGTAGRVCLSRVDQENQGARASSSASGRWV